MTPFDRVGRIVIAGVGLIGGSVGQALKRAGFPGEVVGLGRSWSSLNKALAARAVDSATLDFAEALSGADMLLICTPVNVAPAIAEEAVKHTRDGCIISDVGSTKRRVVADVEKLMHKAVHFVGAHPMAGSHETGVMAADATLFEGSICIITPTESTNPEAVDAVSELWRTVGAQVERMSPGDHDFLIAAASHLPHVVACALIQTVAGVGNNRGKALDFAATGFADATRIAAGDPELWKSILMQNANMVSSMLERIERELAEVRNLLNSGDEERLMEKLEQAKQIRESILP